MMGLPNELVDKLACPQCHGALEYVKKDEKLECHQCRLAFRITDDIPVLIIDEATALQ